MSPQNSIFVFVKTHYPTLLLLIFTLCGNHLWAQPSTTEVSSKFYQYLGSEYPDSSLYYLERWEALDTTSPEVYIASFNYYFSVSESEVLMFDNSAPSDGEALVLMDDSGQVAGSMYSTLQYDQVLVSKGIDAVEKGIQKYPKRLDMYFGKIYVQGVSKRTQDQVQSILDLIVLNHKAPNQWLWENNEPVEDTSLVFSAIQDYLYDYFTSDPPNLEPIETVNNQLVSLYPTHPEFASNEGVIEIYRGDVEKAIVKFKRAQSLAPEDGIILGNLAYCYLEVNEVEKAVEIYQKLLEVGTQEERQIAREYLDSIISQE